jgi:hypothetical protein
MQSQMSSCVVRILPKESWVIEVLLACGFCGCSFLPFRIVMGGVLQREALTTNDFRAVFISRSNFQKLLQCLFFYLKISRLMKRFNFGAAFIALSKCKIGKVS